MNQHWNTEVPIYIQLYQQVVDRILDGYLTEGEMLPSVRQVAAEYQINPLTISKAYQLLQDESVVEKHRGKGMSVKSGAKELLKQSQKQLFLQKEWPAVFARIQRLDLNVQELLSDSASRAKEVGNDTAS